jgi:hypothetical protein
MHCLHNTEEKYDKKVISVHVSACLKSSVTRKIFSEFNLKVTASEVGQISCSV